MSAFLEQATAPALRRTLLGRVTWLLSTWIGATLSAVYVECPFWIIILFAVSSALSASLVLLTYAYSNFGRKRTAAPEWEPPDREGQEFTNGAGYLFGRDLMKILGYETWQSFASTIQRAIGTCTVLNIPVVDNFTRSPRKVDGVECDDYKLTRFACCLTVLNGDTKKPQVAAAQAFLRSRDPDGVDRVTLRY